MGRRFCVCKIRFRSMNFEQHWKKLKLGTDKRNWLIHRRIPFQLNNSSSVSDFYWNIQLNQFTSWHFFLSFIHKNCFFPISIDFHAKPWKKNHAINYEYPFLWNVQMLHEIIEKNDIILPFQTTFQTPFKCGHLFYGSITCSHNSQFSTDVYSFLRTKKKKNRRNYSIFKLIERVIRMNTKIGNSIPRTE